MPLKFAEPYGHDVLFKDHTVAINATVVPDSVTVSMHIQQHNILGSVFLFVSIWPFSLSLSLSELDDPALSSGVCVE